MFAKLGKVTISLVASLSPHGTTRLTPGGLPSNLYESIFQKSVEKIKVPWKI